jgi:hypothetical protein
VFRFLHIIFSCCNNKSKGREIMKNFKSLYLLVIIGVFLVEVTAMARTVRFEPGKRVNAHEAFVGCETDMTEVWWGKSQCKAAGGHFWELNAYDLCEFCTFAGGYYSGDDLGRGDIIFSDANPDGFNVGTLVQATMPYPLRTNHVMVCQDGNESLGVCWYLTENASFFNADGIEVDSGGIIPNSCDTFEPMDFETWVPRLGQYVWDGLRIHRATYSNPRTGWAFSPTSALPIWNDPDLNYPPSSWYYISAWTRYIPSRPYAACSEAGTTLFGLNAAEGHHTFHMTLADIETSGYFIFGVIKDMVLERRGWFADLFNMGIERAGFVANQTVNAFLDECQADNSPWIHQAHAVDGVSAPGQMLHFLLSGTGIIPCLCEDDPSVNCWCDTDYEGGCPSAWKSNGVCDMGCAYYDPECGGGCNGESLCGWSFCCSANPCSLGGGDCDSDSECGPGLTCAQDNGAQFGCGDTVDVCVGTGAVCGNGTCSVTENCTNCPADCGACPYCGDGNCTGDENFNNCSADCGNFSLCYEDCMMDCGEDPCSWSPSCSYSGCENECFLTQCGSTTPPPYCGDSDCNGDETCETCPRDCGACVCGDGQCDSGENCTTCVADCGDCCGNGACGIGENCSNCPADCGACDTDLGGGCNGQTQCGWSFCCSASPCNEGGGDCDSDAECAGNLKCGYDNGADAGCDPIADLCILPGITRIWVGGTAGSGGASVYPYWAKVDSSGNFLSAVSGAHTNYLHKVSNTYPWDASIPTIQPGEKFAIIGNEGGNGTRVFKFYSGSTLVSQITSSTYAEHVIRWLGDPDGNDQYFEFVYNGSQVTYQQKTWGPSCGDGSCNSYETCTTCPADCGSCYCGDGSCNNGETCETCSSDCGSCGGGGY